MIAPTPVDTAAIAAIIIIPAFDADTISIAASLDPRPIAVTIATPDCHAVTVAATPVEGAGSTVAATH